MKYVFIFLGSILFILATLTLRPVNIPKDAKECLVAEGKVVSIYEGGIKDVSFRLEGDKTMYYINRGLEQGLDLEDLKEQLMGQNVTIRYPKHWTLLDPDNRVKHLCILEFEGKELYNEIEMVYGKKEK